MSPLRRLALAASCALAACSAWPAAAAVDAAWAALKAGGHVLVLRHAATEPGTGDPPGFRRGDCATQRNLSAAGREQSRAIGKRLREAGVRVDDVLTSSWCRCIDTAELAFGRSQIHPPLDSFFGDRANEPAQSAAVRERIRVHRGAGTLVMVTHQVNISALTGEHPAMGDAVVLAPGGPSGFTLVGRVPFRPE
jgi:phosphohistidine phosphatase SixA